MSLVLNKVHGGNKEELSLLKLSSFNSFWYSGIDVSKGTNDSLELTKRIMELVFG